MDPCLLRHFPAGLAAFFRAFRWVPWLLRVWDGPLSLAIITGITIIWGSLNPNSFELVEFGAPGFQAFGGFGASGFQIPPSIHHHDHGHDHYHHHHQQQHTADVFM